MLFRRHPLNFQQCFLSLTKILRQNFRVLQEQTLFNAYMEKNGGVDLPFPTTENNVPNKVCANVTFFGKWKTKFVSKSVFPLSRAWKTIGLLNACIKGPFVFRPLEKRKSLWSVMNACVTTHAMFQH